MHDYGLSETALPLPYQSTMCITLLSFSPRRCLPASGCATSSVAWWVAQILRTVYSFLDPKESSGQFSSPGAHDFYQLKSFPSTSRRMELFERSAPVLMRNAVDRLALSEKERSGITHVLVTCCTGLYAPGLDFEIIEHLGLSADVERTMIGFMGCYAAINALKLARHIVRSEPEARVLMLNLELCTLHFQETQDLEQVLSFLVFADGAAASLITAHEQGFALDSFKAVMVPETRELITWKIRGFRLRYAPFRTSTRAIRSCPAGRPIDGRA